MYGVIDELVDAGVTGQRVERMRESDAAKADGLPCVGGRVFQDVLAAAGVCVCPLLYFILPLYYYTHTIGTEYSCAINKRQTSRLR